MNANSIGSLLKLTTFGESHGKAVGFTLEGLPSNFTIDFDHMKNMLDRRKGNSLTKNRKESDEIIVLSGYENNKTIGSNLAIMFENKNQRRSDYNNCFRPSHGDLSYYYRYNVLPLSGGGRLSGRETTCRVAAGSIALQILKKEYDIDIKASIVQIGSYENEFGSELTKDQKQYLEKLEKDGDSTGSILEIRITNCVKGIGDPVFEKLDALLSYSLMSIGSIKAVSIGDGFDCCTKTASTRNDQITSQGFLSNNDGGITGGISNGQEIRIKVASKPTPSIKKSLKSIDKDNNDISVCTNGRHDVCIGLRLSSILEASCALVILDRILIKRAYER